MTFPTKSDSSYFLLKLLVIKITQFFKSQLRSTTSPLNCFECLYVITASMEKKNLFLSLIAAFSTLIGLRSVARSLTGPGIVIKSKKKTEQLNKCSLVFEMFRSAFILFKPTNCSFYSCFYTQAERELRIAQSEFDRQSEITKLLLEGVSSSQAGHLRCLHEFAEAQARHYAQCHATMQDLQRELAGYVE